MVPGFKKPSREKIDDILQARLAALEIPPEMLEQPTSVGTLRDLICSLVEETLIEVSTQAKNELYERQQAGREEAQRRGVMDVLVKNAQTSVFSKYAVFMKRIQFLQKKLPSDCISLFLHPILHPIAGCENLVIYNFA